MKQMQWTNNQKYICSSGVNHRQREGMLAYFFMRLNGKRGGYTVAVWRLAPFFYKKVGGDKRGLMFEK
ncbi:hypothetical protein AGMMS49531_01200 [Endomicrobiia bacterium]|nr:hypothetical protein AGMMS49531_01200 [Endomicrobiia bacterium]